MALRSFDPGRVWIILGGRDKGGDFASLAVDIKERARAVLAMGEAGPAIARDLKRPLAGAVPVHVLPGLGEAFREATAGARAGDVILLGEWIREGRGGA
jgi:UDP-N-acetylmuramoylalanine--D-glutamate ligase